MQIFAVVMGVFYLFITYTMAFYGLHSLFIALLFLRAKNIVNRRKTPAPLDQWPLVTVQLPVFNEKYTIKGLVHAVVNLDYPIDCIQIQILDDSTDETAKLSEELAAQYRAKGVDIECVRRTDRKDFKAGALNEGLKRARGELIAIFDADFIPKPNWLKKTVHLFQNPTLGCLQTRWGHTNRNYNSLTQAEAMAIDGHFVVEQTVRSQNAFFMNFNGTAGLWRRTCIEDAGGWQADTLTEDLDLSYRAQLRGWKIDYLPNVVVPAELPSQVEAFKKQQYRWAKGSFQVIRKLLPILFKQSNLPWSVRLMAFMHLIGYGIHPLILLTLLLTLPVGLWAPAVFQVFPLSMIGSFGPSLLFLVAAAPQTPPFYERLRLLPMVIIMGLGISLNTSIAVLEGLFSKGGTFVRTPKLGGANKRDKKFDRSYLAPISPVVWGEIGLGLYALLTMIILEPLMGWGIIPWMMAYAAGFFYIAGLNLAQHGFFSIRKWHSKSPSIE